jgi:putative FmdB family regulatory protein
MPLYEYQCTKCREVCEVLQKAKDKPLEKCPKCGGPVVKLVSSPSIQFKGSGWYVTDYARKDSSPAGAKPERKAVAKPDAKAGAGEGAKDKSGSSAS